MSTNRPVDDIISNLRDIINDLTNSGSHYDVALELSHQLLEELHLLADEYE